MNPSMNSQSMTLIPVSLGELVDKITILQIKKEHMSGTKLENVDKELQSLEKVIKDNNLKIDYDLISSLKQVNIQLWEIEDKIRIKERDQQFDKEFINLARSVYKENDKRASIKKQINLKYNSALTEEKSYRSY